MFKKTRPTPTARKGAAETGEDSDFVKCKYCGFWCKLSRDVKCPFCESDNYL